MHISTNINTVPKYKLNFLSPLHQNTPNAHSNSKNKVISLPFLSKRQKIKTCPPETHQQSSLAASTPPNRDSSSEKSASTRQLTRMIYHHLQKKITLHQKTFRNINNTTANMMQAIAHPAHLQQQFIFTNKNKKFNRHIYAYQKELKNNPHYTQHLQYRNRINFANNVLTKNDNAKSGNIQNLGYSNKNKSPLTCIDAYFDLSCLQTCNPIKKHVINYNI